MIVHTPEIKPEEATAAATSGALSQSASASAVAASRPLTEPVGGVFTTAGFKIKLLKAGKGRLLPVRGSGELVVQEGQVSTSPLIYDPRGSVWISLALTLVSAILLAFVAQRARLGLPISWLIWYFIVRAWRKQRTPLNLPGTDIEDAVIDPERGYLAFKTLLGDRRGWIGMAVSPMPSDMITPLQAA